MRAGEHGSDRQGSRQAGGNASQVWIAGERCESPCWHLRLPPYRSHRVTMAFSATISRAPTASTAPVTTGMPMGMVEARIMKAIWGREQGRGVQQESLKWQFR